MYKFIAVLCGATPESEYIDNWQDVYTEYLELIGDEKVERSVSLDRDIRVLQNKITQISLCAGLIGTNEDARAWVVLRGFGILQENRIDPVLKKYNIDVITKQKQLTELQKTEQNSKSITPADFENNLVVLSKAFNGMNTDSRDITVARYCALVNQLKQENARDRSNK